MSNSRTTCPTCGSITTEYIFRFSYLDCRLLFAMANIVKWNMQEGLGFTESNLVHVPSLAEENAVICRTTIASKLGLVAKVRNENGDHKQGHWLITARGWAALRGEPVPSNVSVFRKKITERSGDLITIHDAWKEGRDKLNSMDWVEFGRSVVNQF